ASSASRASHTHPGRPWLPTTEVGSSITSLLCRLCGSARAGLARPDRRHRPPVLVGREAAGEEGLHLFPERLEVDVEGTRREHLAGASARGRQRQETLERRRERAGEPRGLHHAVQSAIPRSPWASAGRSTPVENARPAPVSATTRISGRSASVATAALRSRAKRASPALSTSGRASVRRASAPAISSRIVASEVIGQWFTIRGLVTSLLALLCLGIFATTFSTGAFPAILPELARGGALADWQVA